MRASLPLTYLSIYRLHHLPTNPTLTPTHHSLSAIMTCALCLARRTFLPSISFNPPVFLSASLSFIPPSLSFHSPITLSRFRSQNPLDLSILRNVFREKHPLTHSTPFHSSHEDREGEGSFIYLSIYLPACLSALIIAKHAPWCVCGVVNT